MTDLLEDLKSIEIDFYGNKAEYLRFPDEDGNIYGRFDHEFLEYNEDNFGITEVDLGL